VAINVALTRAKRAAQSASSASLRPLTSMQLEQEAPRDAHVRGLLAGDCADADAGERLDDHARRRALLVLGRDGVFASWRAQQQRVADDLRRAVVDRLPRDRDGDVRGHGCWDGVDAHRPGHRPDGARLSLHWTPDAA
jgi:hypothetical protein